jgi:tellurite resistance protein TerC
MNNELILWIVFGLVVAVILGLDLGVFNRKAHVIKMKEALVWSAALIAIALLFDLLIYFMLGTTRALNFLNAYLIEKSLSVDNLFIFLVIFTYFNVPETSRHRVLFWGIIGALIMRALFIVIGLTAIEKIHWIIYIFGAFLIYTGIRLSFGKEREIHPEKNVFVRLVRRMVPVTSDYRQNSFLTRENARVVITPLLLVLLVVETTDVLFAVDSIPAVLSITLDPLIVYTSNIFAILGLRALFFVLAGFTQRLSYLSYGLAAILIFLGLKMVSSDFFPIPVGISLGVVFGILIITVLASIIRSKEKTSGNK